MSKEAAVAAAAAAAAAAMALEAKTEKSFATALITVPKLVDSNFESVDQALKRVAYKCHWATWILESKVAEPARLSDKDEADKRNAYLIITEKVQGHQVQYPMEMVKLGDAKAAYAVFFDHFHRATAAGRHESTRNFYNATMANTNSNIMEWLAMVPRRGKLLELVGGRADDGD